MPASNVTICNAALAMLGEQTIASLDEPTNRARLCKDLYEPARQMLLRMHPWNCATKRVLLAPLVDKPAFGYGAQFQLPDDFIRVQSVNTQDYVVEGQKLLASESEIQLIYTYNNDNEASWDSMLIEAMSLLMAAKLTKALTGSTTDADMREAALSQFLKRARAVDSQEQPMMQIDPMNSGFLDVRY